MNIQNRIYTTMVGVLLLSCLLFAQNKAGRWQAARALPQAAGSEPVMVQVAPAEKGTLTFHYSFPDVKTRLSDSLSNVGGYERILMGNAPLSAKEGEPRLPVVPCQFIVPQGRCVDAVVVTVGRQVLLAGKHVVEYGEALTPLLPGAKPRKAERKKSIYDSDNPYPGITQGPVMVQKKRGVSIAIVSIHPAAYFPKSGRIVYCKDITVTITTKPDSAATGQKNGIRVRKFHAGETGVENPEELDSYPAQGSGGAPASGGGVGTLGICTPSLSYQYVVITSAAIRDAATDVNIRDLVAHKQARGISATIVTVEDIYGSYSGIDNAEKIRNFIIDAYNNWETGFVLLGGDINIVPMRKLYCYAGGEIDNIPSDLYFQCLDGNYNSDGDANWGEPTDGVGGADVDLMAEVSVGRASVENAAEMSNFVYKTLAYENESEAAPYLRNALMCGEYLGFGGVADYATASMEEIRLGSSANGYTTAGFASCPAFTVGTLYDSPSYTWQKSDILARINSNSFGIINHLGHANDTYVMKFYNADADILTNNKFPFAYSQACLPGNFENDCMAEHLTTSTRSGMFAVVFNSRYGWGMGNSTDGPSQRFDRQFWNAYFGKKIFSLGEINAQSHEDNIWDINGECIRWCYYETNLLGDPQTFLRGQATGPSLSYLSHTISDATGGNGDGIINPGESVALRVTLANSGSAAANGVTAVLSSSDPNISVSSATAAFGDIPCCGASKTALGDFSVTVAPSCPTPHTATLALDITDGAGTLWSSQFNISIYSSVQIGGFVRALTGNNPIAGATVAFSGPLSGAVQTGADGHYFFGAIDGTYSIIASAAGYSASPPAVVTVPPGVPNVNFLLGRPDLAVSPDHISASVAVGGQTSSAITMFNGGDQALIYSIVPVGDATAQLSLNQLGDSLVAYYTFNEGTGNTLYDHSTFGNNGTIAAGAVWTDGVQGKALRFNGISDYVQVPDPANKSLNFGRGNFTVSAWVLTTAESGGDAGRQDILSKGDPYNSGFTLSAMHDRFASFVGLTSRTGYSDTSAIINDGVWHYVVTKRESGLVRLFVDGVQKHQYACSDSLDAGSALFIGRHGLKSESYFTGSIDEIKLFKKALSNADIVHEYQAMRAPWISASPSSGTIAPGGSTMVSVVFDAQYLLGGTHNGKLEISHNAQGRQNPFVIPCALYVDGMRRLSVSPQSLDFGNVWTGRQGAAILTLTNPGDEETRIDALSCNNGVFTSSAALPLTVPPFGSITIGVTFAPGIAQSEIGVLTITSNAEDNPSLYVSLAGQGVNPPRISLTPQNLSASLNAGETTVKSLTITNSGDEALTYSITPASLGTLAAGSLIATFFPVDSSLYLNPVNDTVARYKGFPSFSKCVYMSASPHQIAAHPLSNIIVLEDYSFSSSYYYDIALQNLGLPHTLVTAWHGLENELKNGTAWNLVIVNSSSTSAPSAVLDLLDAYVKNGGRLIYADWGIASYASHNLLARLGVSFVRDFTVPMNIEPVGASNPLFTGTHAIAGVHVERNLVQKDGQVVAALPGATRLATFEGITDGCAILLNNAGTTIFNGFAAANSIRDTAANAGYDVVELIENEIEYVLGGSVPWLSATPQSGTVAAQSSADVNVTFNASALYGGIYQAQLSITHNAPNSGSPIPVPCNLTVQGYRRLSVTPQSCAFGSVQLPQSKSATLTLANTGTEATTIAGLSSNNSVFACGAACPFTVAPGQQVSITVVFTPARSGAESGVLTINSNAADNPALTVALLGTGVIAPAIAIDPGQITANCAFGRTIDKILTITNTGGDMLNVTLSQVVGGGGTIPMACYYSLDDGSGSVLFDRSGKGNNGAIVGAAWCNGVLGSGLNFNGSTNYASVTHPPTGDFDFGTQDFTVCAWVKTTATTGGDAQRDDIFSLGDPYNSGVTLSLYNNRFASFVGLTARTGYSDASRIINDGVWHFVLTKRESGVVKLYTDGVLQHQYGCTQNVTVASPLYIGRHGTKSESFFSGSIDEIKMFKRALTDGEILSEYQMVRTPWLTAQPAQGTILPGTSMQVTVTLDARITAPGSYTGSLIITHNGVNAASPVAVPVAMNVYVAGSYVSRICQVGASAQAEAKGSSFSLNKIIIGSPCQDVLYGSQYRLHLMIE
jgi:hypothetical protein